MTPDTPNLSTETVLLRPLQLSDIDGLWKQSQDESLFYYFTFDLSKREVLEDWVKTALHERELGTRIPFAIVDAKNGEVMGSTSFGSISLRDSRMEIGWTWLGRAFHGTGVNAQAKYLMLQHGFEVWNLERIELKTDVLNKPARGAVLKIGMVEEGVLRSHTLMTNNRRRDTIYYSLLKQEWPEVKKKFTIQ